MQNLLKTAVRMSLVLTAALLTTWVLLASSSSKFPLEWQRAGSSMFSDSVASLALARN